MWENGWFERYLPEQGNWLIFLKAGALSLNLKSRQSESCYTPRFVLSTGLILPKYGLSGYGGVNGY